MDRHQTNGEGPVRICLSNTVQQYLNAGLLDEMHLHLAHVLLGSGTRLFDKLTITPANLEKIAVVDTPGVTHLKFRVLK
jgi:dihydrofolate reductase